MKVEDLELAACSEGRRPPFLSAEAWFPHPSMVDPLAQAVCASCLVREVCLAEGLEARNRNHGIWGGYTPYERRLLLTKRRTLNLFPSGYCTFCRRPMRVSKKQPSSYPQRSALKTVCRQCYLARKRAEA